MRTVVERLRAQARRASEISRSMAEDKSLRQEGNTERRTDLYMWPAPEQTTEGQAAALIEELLGLVDESLFHLRLDEAAKAYHERALAALAKAHHPEEVLK